MAREERAERPREGREQDGRGAREVHARAAEADRAHEKDDTGDPERDADERLGGGRRRSWGSVACRRTMKSGSTATRRAARPDAIRSSAQTTPPLPQRSISPPVRNAGPRSRRATRGAPRTFANRRRALPATRYRTPDRVKGGIVSSPQRIARYVEPQTT
jgi:hypothetical protein